MTVYKDTLKQLKIYGFVANVTIFIYNFEACFCIYLLNWRCQCCKIAVDQDSDCWQKSNSRHPALASSREVLGILASTTSSWRWQCRRCAGKSSSSYANSYNYTCNWHYGHTL